jgi:hypothetical protein
MLTQRQGLHTSRTCANRCSAPTTCGSMPRSAMPCAVQPRRSTLLRTGAHTNGQSSNDSGLWLPPQRPRRTSVQAHAASQHEIAKIKVCGAATAAHGMWGQMQQAMWLHMHARAPHARACPSLAHACTGTRCAVSAQVVGVGGGGSNAVNRMLESQLTGVELMVMNTDAQVGCGRCGGR